MSCRNPVLITISSRDRISGNSNDFLVNLVQGGFEGSKSVVLQSVTIPKSIYNINLSNNVFSINDGTVKVVTLTPGNYTINQLCTEVQTELEAVSLNSYTVTYNSITMRVSILNSGAVDYLFNLGGPWRELGFNNIATGVNSSITAPNIPILYWPLSALILVDKFPLGGYNSNSSRYTFRVPLNVNNNDILNYEPMHWQELHLGNFFNANLGQLRVTLSGPDGNLLDIGNGDWDMVCKLSF